MIKDGRFSRINISQTEALLSASRPTLPDESTLATLRTVWRKIETAVLAAAETRSTDRMRNLQNTLERRSEQELRDITEVLEQLAASIRQRLQEPQYSFAWTAEEQEQLRRNTDSLINRLAAIPEEIQKERVVVANRYTNPVAHTFPVAVVFLVPESMTRPRT
jgi:protoheme ferro-lyase